MQQDLCLVRPPAALLAVCSLLQETSGGAVSLRCSPASQPSGELVAETSLPGNEPCVISRAMPVRPTSSAAPLVNLVLNLTSGWTLWIILGVTLVPAKTAICWLRKLWLFSKQSDKERKSSHVSFRRKREDSAEQEDRTEMRGIEGIGVPNKGLSNA